MRRLARILLNILTAVSIVLCAATVVLWVRSYRTADQVLVGGYLVASEFGAVYVSPVARDRGYPVRESFDAGKLGVFEKEWGHDVRRGRPVRFIWRIDPTLPPRPLVVVADWLIVLALVVLPAYRLARRLRRRHRPDLCAACGYDLRATPKRCPECGNLAAWRNTQDHPAAG